MSESTKPITSLLLKLPSELRLHIYSYCMPQPALLARPSTIIGLVYSCKLIRHELESEISRGMIRHITNITEKCRLEGEDIVYTPPDTLHGWFNLTISRPKTPRMFRKQDPILEFKYLYFNVFTVIFHGDAGGYDNKPEDFRYAVRHLTWRIGKHQSTDSIPAMKKWVVDWNADPNEHEQKVVGCAIRVSWGSGWKHQRFRHGNGAVTRMEFSKIDSQLTDSWYLPKTCFQYTHPI
ncbi:hypothetical protein P153DRAFT_368807 [Dothidotthia symphoricarpi CBS 119687]|uniref:F-box domain-containing protein n=1 Tax=Dothidotthia symphoricarpi CBS 119687 TaxID=1392245 RepID=A0A6A6A7J2_9PLEO|nr:uncharacterized protein P153DRAFT_368807 [Dothidotthia symphoricarpi CBS 119687]KAF2126758.1 hypothetical protein P153DRAFT_368807 [Dothidotthia symphoricarpi CBS 119687]